jgi:hypothetical protein
MAPSVRIEVETLVFEAVPERSVRQLARLLEIGDELGLRIPVAGEVEGVDARGELPQPQGCACGGRDGCRGSGHRSYPPHSPSASLLPSVGQDQLLTTIWQSLGRLRALGAR